MSGEDGEDAVFVGLEGAQEEELLCDGHVSVVAVVGVEVVVLHDEDLFLARRGLIEGGEEVGQDVRVGHFAAAEDVDGVGEPELVKHGDGFGFPEGTVSPKKAGDAKVVFILVLDVVHEWVVSATVEFVVIAVDEDGVGFFFDGATEHAEFVAVGLGGEAAVFAKAGDA